MVSATVSQGGRPLNCSHLWEDATLQLERVGFGAFAGCRDGGETDRFTGTCILIPVCRSRNGLVTTDIPYHRFELGCDLRRISLRKIGIKSAGPSSIGFRNAGAVKREVEKNRPL